MSKIAFLGLGQMGTPMAGRLLQAGHDIRVRNRRADRRDLARRNASLREPGALDQVATLAVAWFLSHLAGSGSSGSPLEAPGPEGGSRTGG